jgi:hypothetical protein
MELLRVASAEEAARSVAHSRDCHFLRTTSADHGDAYASMGSKIFRCARARCSFALRDGPEVPCIAFVKSIRRTVISRPNASMQLGFLPAYFASSAFQSRCTKWPYISSTTPDPRCNVISFVSSSCRQSTRWTRGSACASLALGPC